MGKKRECATCRGLRKLEPLPGGVCPICRGAVVIVEDAYVPPVVHDCRTCGATGSVPGPVDCTACDGTGKARG